ncbi:MAG: putative lipoprotein [Proteobacteria bacterium]|nr:putative lipoprotein [Pseudomonadota bacterium]
MYWFSKVALSLISLLATYSLAWADFEEDYESKQWQEVEVTLPEAPKERNLVSFYVSAATSNRFYIDASTLSVGGDGVVRYVLLVLSPEGGRNVTFEGMRCESRERRIYASGRLDGSWSKARKNEWVRIQDAYANRHHAALFLDYFCPFGNIVHNAAEARNALMLGGHPDNKRW